jgi:hypothetical protein
VDVDVMKRARFVIPALLLIGLLPGAALSSTATKSVLSTRGEITAISADGARVAAAVQRVKKGCDRIVVWNGATKKTTGFNLSVDCGGGQSVIDAMSHLVLAGSRLAWVELSGGNSLELVLKTRTLTAKKISRVAYAANGDGAGGQVDGGWLGNLVGDGNLIAFNSWDLCSAVPAGEDAEDDLATCVQPAPRDQEILIASYQRLKKVVGGKGVTIMSAPDTQAPGGARPVAAQMSLVALAANAGRIAILEPSGAVLLVSAMGAVLKEIAVAPGTLSGAALQGSQLIMLRNGKLELYDTVSGTLTKTIPLPAGSPAPVLRDLQRGLAVYVRGRAVHVLRLADGKSLTITAPGSGPVDAQIEPTGLYHSYNLPKAMSHGRVVFIPFHQLLTRLG